MKSRGQLVVIIVLVCAALVLYITSRSKPNTVEQSLTQVAARVREGEVASIEVEGDRLTVVLKDGSRLLSLKEADSTLPEQLRSLGITPEVLEEVDIEIVPPTDWVGLANTLGTIVLLLAFAGGVYLIMRQFQGANSQAIAFGKSRARMYTGDQPTVTFDDVAGVDEAKEELTEVVEFLKEPEKFIQLGARIPKGVLLVGAPGTGKTLMAKAVSGEAGVPFFSISGSEFVEMFVGVGASRVRDLFEQAKRHSPCIVFLDEIDAVGRHRGAGLGGSHDEREQTLNQILVEMDGFDTDTNVIIMAATNRPDILDPALLRPGRFDRRVVLDRPDIKGREEILRVHVRGKPVAEGVELKTVARSTPGFVGADIENLVNEAAILAARRDRKTIGMDDFEEAVERVLTGPERKSRLISDEEKRITAYHEAGHAVVAHVLPKCNPVHKVSIVARGMASGYTLALPEEDRRILSKARFRDDLAFGLGGRAAEELVLGDVTTGAANDLERVTEIARAMVTRYGMSDKLGPMTFGQKEELVFLGKEIGEQRDYGEAVAQEIDEEVRHIVHEAHDRATDVLERHREQLERVAQHLIENETVEAEEFVALFEGREPGTSGTPTPDTADELPDGQPVRKQRGKPALDLPPQPAPA